ncbi:MAG: trehalose-phosphatase, partial [Actinomyces sp.]
MNGPPVDDPELLGRIEELSRAPVLLVACDYDGTIAPLVDDPMKAFPLRETSVALRSLALLPQTHVAVISGRSLRDLAALSRLPAEIHLVGSHGSEFDIDFALELDHELRERRRRLLDELRRIEDEIPGVILERKPASVAVHYRRVDPDRVPDLLEQVGAVADAIGDLTVRHGKQVCELLLIPTDKGAALDTVRKKVGATTVLFIGDDVTDEAAFATLHGPDVGVKVGPGDTIAPYRVPDPPAVARLLATLCHLRADWLAGAGVVPIERHSLLSDQRTAALVTPEARITWMCVPRVDSAAIFAEILGGPPAGYFAVRPLLHDGEPVQRYLDSSLVLRTSWPDITVTDYLDCSDGRPGRLAGRTDLIRVIEGHGRALVEFAPRLDFGRFPTSLEVRDGGLEVVGATDLVVLRSPGVEWTIEQVGMHQTAVAEVDCSAGPVVLELRCGTASLRPDRSDEATRREATRRWWS